jgi:pimeloyl-ACP methyl ester carboxylesterase
MPALFVAGDRDPVIAMVNPQMMDGWVTDLRGMVLIPGAGHWTQQERPDEVNAALLEFLSSLG